MAKKNMRSLRDEDPEKYEEIKARIATFVKYRDQITKTLNQKGGLFNPKVAITSKIKEIIEDELPDDLDNKSERISEIIKRVEKEILGAIN